MNGIPVSSEVLGGMITPAVLISASGVLVPSTSNRVGRAIDRVRVLAAEVERLQMSAESVSTLIHIKEFKCKHIGDQLVQHRACNRVHSSADGRIFQNFRSKVARRFKSNVPKSLDCCRSVFRACANKLESGKRVPERHKRKLCWEPYHEETKSVLVLFLPDFKSEQFIDDRFYKAALTALANEKE
jgi:hypothetical protein